MEKKKAYFRSCTYSIRIPTAEAAALTEAFPSFAQFLVVNAGNYAYFYIGHDPLFFVPSSLYHIALIMFSFDPK
jgi:hypothetical protein